MIYSQQGKVAFLVTITAILLSDHTEALQKIHAIGFITNIKCAKTLDQLQNLSGLPLLPANVDDLIILLATAYYPLMANDGVVWQ